MAANKKGGSDSPIDFPLYLNFDQCTNFGLMTSCERAADETSIILYEYLKEVAQQYGEYNYGYHLNEDVLNSFGIDIYIEGGHVNRVSLAEYDYAISMRTDGEYDHCTLRIDGVLIYEN